MAATSIDPDQDLVKTLEHVRTPGSFTGYGILDPLDPQLYVPEIGIISIPLQNAQAKNLIRACHQAPFGKGSETVLDLSIRNTQELNADQFEIRNPAWQEYISRTTERAARDLGVCGQNVRADLYKLLLYGPGAHFHKHKDTEKARGMFATLVISLPSPHVGGALRLWEDHNTSPFEYETSHCLQSYLCWYADVEHAVQPVVSGYRCVLTYNLIRTNEPSMNLPLVSDNELELLDKALGNWTNARHEPELLKERMYLLDHEYTDASLKLNFLKGNDLIRVLTLQRLCGKYDLCLFLASLERQVLRSMEWYEPGYRKRGRWGESSESSGPEVEIGDVVEIIDDALQLKRIVDLDGQEVAINFDIDEDQILQKGAFEGREPDNEESSGYTGNEGVTSTLWYKDTVVLLVPRSRLIIFLFSSLAKNSIWDTSRKEEPSKDTIARGFAYLEKTYEQQPESRARNDLTSACNLLISKSILAAKSDLMYPWKASLSLALSAGAVLKDVALFNLAVGHIDEEVDPIVHQKPEKLDPLVFGKIAALLLTSGLSPIHTSLDKIIAQYSTIRDRCQAIKALLGGSIDERIHIPVNDPKLDLKEWIAEKLCDMLDNTTEIRTPDAEYLVEILTVRRNFDEDLPRILRLLEKHSSNSSFTVEFLAQLFDAGRQELVSQEMVVDTFRTVLPNLASKISLRDPENKTNPPAERGMFSYEPPPKREPPVDGMLLASLLSHTLFSLNLQPETFDLMESIRKEVNHIHSDDFHGMIFPFLHGLLTALMVRNISPTSAEYGSRFPRFFRSVIRRYLALYVRPEPKRPKNWTRDPVPSHCDDCNWLSCFLQDPNAMTGKFPCAVKRRRHLEGRIGDVSRRGEYNLETDHNGNSLTLIITKTEKKWEREWAEWEKRCCEAHKKIDELFKLVPKSELVGNDFDISPTRLPSGINDHGAPEQPVVQRMYAPHFDPIVSTNPKFRRQGWRGNADVAEHYAHEYYASRPARHIPIGPGPEPPRNQQPALSMREISQRISRQFRTAASTRITPLAPNSTNKATSPRGTKRKIETVDLTDD